MENLVNITNQANRYSKNLFSEQSLINDNSVINYNYNTVSGGYTLSEKDSFTGVSKAMKAYVFQDVISGISVDFDLADALKYTADKDGNYIFQYSFMFTEINANPDTLVDFNVKMFKKSILVETFTNTINLHEFEINKYYNFAQSFDLDEGDLVDFSFSLERPSIGPPNFNFEVCFDGFKLEKNSYNFSNIGIPSFYSLPVTKITGWQSKVDTINSQNLTENTDNLIAFTGVDAYNEINNLMDSVGKITPKNVNDAICVDFVFSFPSPSGTNDFLSVKLKVNGIVYRAQSFNILEPIGETNYVSVSFSLSVMEDFKEFGGLIYVNPSTNITISNRYLQVTRTHKGQ